MACLEKLAIQGVRSFIPDHDETIEFYSPLTVIVGHNGCGKTTIIEALKFACTGTLPPNSNKGQSFVNDPTVTDSTEVKATVKLRFQGRGGYPQVVTRSLQVLKKKTKLEFKTLDGVLKTTNERGEKVSSSQKCSDLDTIVPELLGVSPAILDNVIFCHQEESNWPMQEGSALKKKFDDVFESTRYTKALDAIAKSKKEYADQGKSLWAELVELRAQCEAANETKKEVAKCEEDVENCTTELEQNKDRLERLEDKLQQTFQIINEAQKLENGMKEIKIRVEESTRRISDKKGSLDTLYEDLSNGELEIKLHTFDETLVKQQGEITSLQKQINDLLAEIATLRKRGDEVNILKGQSETTKELFESEFKKLKNESIAAVNHCGLSPTIVCPDWNAASYKSLMQSIEQKLEKVKQEGEVMLADARLAHANLEKQFQDTQSKLQKVEVELSTKDFENGKLVNDITRQKGEALQLSTARAGLSMLENDHLEAIRSYDAFNTTASTRAIELKRLVKETGDQLRDIQGELTVLSGQQSELSAFRHELAGLAAAEKHSTLESTQFKNELESALVTHRDGLLCVKDHPTLTASSSSAVVSSILQHLSTQGSHSVNAALAELKSPSDLNELSSSLNQVLLQQISLAETKKSVWDDVKSQKSGLEAVLKQVNERLTTAEQKASQIENTQLNQLSQYVHELNDIRTTYMLVVDEADLFSPFSADNMTVETLINAVDDVIEVASQLISIDKVGKFIKKQLAKNLKKGGCCPLCENRAVAEDVYARNLDEVFLSLSKKMKMSKEAYEEATEKLKDLIAKVQRLEYAVQSKKDLDEEVSKLITQKNDQILPRLNELQEVDTKAKDEVKSLDTKIVLLQKAHTTLTELGNRWIAIATRQTELGEKRKRSTQASSMFSAGLDTNDKARSIEEIEERIRQLNEQKDECQTKREKHIMEESNLSKKLFQMKSAVGEREREYQEANAKVLQLTNLETAIKTAQHQSEQLQQEIHQLTAQKGEISRNKEQLQLQIRTSSQRLQESEKTLSNRISEIISMLSSIRRLETSVQELETKISKMNTRELLDRATQIASEIASLEQNISILQPKLNKLNKELSSQEHSKNQVKGNLELRQFISDHTRLQSELRSFESKLSEDSEEGRKLRTARRENQRAEQEKQRLCTERDKLTGNIEIYTRQVEEKRRKLESTTYRGVEEKFRKKTIEHEVTTMTVNDLDCYYKALDSALQNFHILKIREINKIIRELWQVIYKGQDIDMIEIESGEEAESGGASSTAVRGKRSYNYRVVMRKGDTPLDMRGRCSAGQKVLAAIVIRLALAETFCLSCGILALDEPTTNLDEANKRGLAYALARIIIDRSEAKEKNFQLICITHDEDFVHILNTELSGKSSISVPEFCFRVSRQELNNSGKFFSNIERVRWENM